MTPPFARASARRSSITSKRWRGLSAADLGVVVSPDSLFDVQVKRLHEYKRQLLLVLYIIVLYNRLKSNPALDIVPRTFIIGGKAAPGYAMAKLIIKLIHQVAGVINSDAQVNEKIKIAFLPNYRVSLAEKVIPAANLSEQISLAGTEASGTGNMKFQLNGAVTIGTLDGANVEILEEVGKKNIFIFGLTAQEVEERGPVYNPWDVYNADEEIRRAVQMIERDFFSMMEPGIFRPVTKSLLEWGDYYMLLADLRDYIETQERVDAAYQDTRRVGQKGDHQRSAGRQVLIRPRDSAICLRDLAYRALRDRTLTYRTDAALPSRNLIVSGYGRGRPHGPRANADRRSSLPFVLPASDALAARYKRPRRSSNTSFSLALRKSWIKSVIRPGERTRTGVFARLVLDRGFGGCFKRSASLVSPGGGRHTPTVGGRWFQSVVCKAQT